MPPLEIPNYTVEEHGFTFHLPLSVSLATTIMEKLPSITFKSLEDGTINPELLIEYCTTIFTLSSTRSASARIEISDFILD